MKDLLTGCLTAALLLTAACAQPEPFVAAPGVSVEKLDCADGYGSQTVVGDVRLTAWHVADTCGPEGDTFPHLDLSVLDAGSGTLPSCRRPYAGERLLFTGFPSVKPNGDRVTNPRARPVETDTGKVMETETDLLVNFGGKKFRVIESGSTSSSDKVRGGYSGGAVTSAVTGEFLGIISAAMTDGSLTFFVSAEEICQALKEVSA